MSWVPQVTRGWLWCTTQWSSKVVLPLQAQSPTNGMDSNHSTSINSTNMGSTNISTSCTSRMFSTNNPISSGGNSATGAVMTPLHLWRRRQRLMWTKIDCWLPLMASQAPAATATAPAIATAEAVHQAAR